MPDPDKTAPPTTQTATAGTTAASVQAGAAEVLATAGNVVVTLPQSTLKQIKDRAAAKGQAQATEALEAQAKAAGFSSWAEALGALAAVKGKGAAPDATTAQPPAAKAETGVAGAVQTPGAPAPLSKEDVAALAAQAAAQAVAAYKAEQDKLQAEVRAKTATADALKAAGFADTDYAAHLMQGAMAATPEGAQFDPSAWATEVKKARPYLFADFKPAAATSGLSAAGAAGAGVPPTPAQVATGAAAATKVDAFKLSPAEVEANLRKMGINLPSRAFI